MQLALAATLLLLAPATAGAQGAEPAQELAGETQPAPEPTPDRCEAAKTLLADQPKIAIRELEKALRTPATRRCAVDALVEHARGAEKAYTRCEAGKDLLTKDLVEAAKGQYQKALDADPPQSCGVAGLASVEAAEREEDERDSVVTPKEVVSEIGDVVGEAWPWVAALALLVVLRSLFGIRRLVVQSSKHDEELAKRVVAAANASGEKGPAPAKVVVGPDEVLPEKQVADISKLLRLPGTAVLGELLRLAASAPFTLSRLTVRSAVAGGWAVIELDFRRTFARKQARISLPLGDLDEKKVREVLGLAGGAWLVAQLERDDESSPIPADGEDPVIYHASFRAGAACQSRGEVEAARACYAGMPENVCFRDAPFAWVGARVNQMMALASGRRWGEATAFAEVVAAYPPDDAPIAADAIADLRRRRRYMTAIVRVNHFYWLSERGEDGSDLEEARQKAEEAVKELESEEQGDANDDANTVALRRAIRMVVLCFSIANGGPKTRADVEEELALEGETPREPQPMLGAAAYYDAACAVTMLAKRHAAGTKQRKEHVEYAFALLEMVVAATPEARLPRVRAMAKADAMLAPLRESKADLARFEKIMKEEAKGEPEAQQDTAPPTVGEALAQLMASLRGPSA